MPDQTGNKINNLNPDEEEYTKLIRDLKSLPRVSAPPDFDFKLKQRIAEKSRNPWWKKLFIPARSGGYPIPAYAYGAVGAVAIVVVSLVVFQPFQMRETLESIPDTEERILEDKSGQLPKMEPAEPSSGEDIEQIPVEREIEQEGEIPLHKRAVEPGPAKPFEKKGIESPEKQRAKKRPDQILRKETPPQTAPLPVETQEYLPAIRGIEHEKLDKSAIPDSARIRDSLRVIDSLRKIKESGTKMPGRKSE